MDVGAFDDAAIVELCPPAYVGEAAYRNKGDDVRELLEEVRDFIRYSISALPMGEKDLDRAENIFNKIDTALAAPEPDAMELARQVRAGNVVAYAQNNDLLHATVEKQYKLTDSEAAALIADYSKLVPRAMLYEINEFEDDYPRNIDPKMDAVAAKYGYRAE